jgi:hypothetical protein
MEYVLGALAVFWIWIVVESVVSMPEWAWYVAITAFGLLTGLVIDLDTWYWGLALSAVAYLLKRLDDLLLVAADRVRVEVLRRTQR